MINYSLSARSVNPGNTESEKKIFANAQVHEVLDLQQFARHISQHGSPYTRDVIVGVVTAVVDCLREELLDGNKVSLGDLGSFYVTFSGEGVDKADDYNPQTCIKKVNIRWDAGRNFADLKQEATFNLVSTRKQQQIDRKAEKEALNLLVGTSASDSNDNTGGSGNQSGSGDNPDVTE
ncbi:MAG: DNA-binding protein [Bacteroidaceae bacterium]|nr:DNA-binding protein [Bacteroidaceae bacterium]